MRRFIFILTVLTLLAGCTNQEEKQLEGEEQKGRVNNEFVHVNNELGTTLLKNIESKENENIFLSPSSVLIALLMAYNGAAGDTKEEMAEVIGIDNGSVDEVNKQAEKFIHAITRNINDNELLLANSIWLHDEYYFQKNFQETTEKIYDASINKINRDDDKEIDKINEWVKEATKGKVTDLVEGSLDPNFVTFLINAIYFNGKWASEFQEESTIEDIFYTKKGEEKTSFMQQTEDFLYMKTEDFQAIKLPYSGEELSMNIFLPNDSLTPLDLVQNGIINEMETEKTAFEETEVYVMMPAFELEYEADLTNVFKAVGMELAFNKEAAQFPYLLEESPPQVWIEAIKQKTYIEVNEEGTEAAGATSVEMQTTSAPLDEPEQMVVNRPFLFTITHEELGAHLFTGILATPK